MDRLPGELAARLAEEELPEERARRQQRGALAYLNAEPPPAPEVSDLEENVDGIVTANRRSGDLRSGWRAAQRWAEERDHAAGRRWAEREVLELLPLSNGDGGTRYAVLFPDEERTPPAAADSPERACLWHAMHHLDGADLRWTVRRELGRTQDDLLEDIDRELGTVHGSGFNEDDPPPAGYRYYAEGRAAEKCLNYKRKRPRVEVKRRAGDGWDEVTTYMGEELVEEVRILMNVPDPAGATHGAQMNLM